MAYKDRAVMLAYKRLWNMRRALKNGNIYSPRTPESQEIREAKARRKLHWRLVQVIYRRLKVLGGQSIAARRRRKRYEERGGKERRNAARRAKYQAERAAKGLPPRRTKEQQRQARRMYERNRDRRTRGGKVRLDMAEWLHEQQRGRCAVCGVRPKEFHLDHIEPLARGGVHCESNLQLLCPPCNLKKAAKDPIRFMQEMGRLL
jgi:5-methylcytosine-specific restriction endonuclease McrA